MALSTVLTFAGAVSRFILDSLNSFSLTKVAPNYSPTSPTNIYYFSTDSSTTSVSVWPSVIPYVSIA